MITFASNIEFHGFASNFVTGIQKLSIYSKMNLKFISESNGAIMNSNKKIIIITYITVSHANANVLVNTHTLSQLFFNVTLGKTDLILIYVGTKCFLFSFFKTSSLCVNVYLNIPLPNVEHTIRAIERKIPLHNTHAYIVKC